MDKIVYNNLLDSLEEKQCTLILGPEFFLLNNPEELISFRDMIYKNRLSESPYVIEDGFFNTDKYSGFENKNAILSNIKKYFKELQVPDYYYKIAQIPFSSVVSISPDDLLAKAMTSLQQPYHFSYYKKQSGLYFREIDKANNTLKWSEPRDVTDEELHSSDTFLFNFFGHYSDTQSMIFTYDALFDFLYSVFPVDNLSIKLRSIINKSVYFLFLGFGYDKWYLKIIFFTLEKMLQGEKAKKAVCNYSNSFTDTAKIYENQFQLNFFKESTLDFINKLYTDCESREILRQPIQSQPAITAPQATQYKILFVAARPDSFTPLDYVAEYEKIKDVHVHLPNLKRDEFYIPDMQPFATQKKLFLKTTTEKPDILIISMHGSQTTGLLLQGENGESKPLSLPDFLKDIQLLTQDPLNKLQCIIFSCCHTAEFAKEVCKYIPFAIGMNGPIQDEAMPVFLEGFFTSFFNDNNIKEAFKTGKRLVEKDDTLDEDNASMIEFFSRQ
jgi:hypothetical protein